MEAARAFGIAFDVGEATRERYRGFGIDLAERSGEGHGLLPVPSVFLVAPGGRILWVYSNPDYKVRPDNDAVLAAARAVAEAADPRGAPGSGEGDGPATR